MRCSQTRIHSALPFTAPPLLFVCRLPPISTAARPLTNTVGYQNKELNGGANSFVAQTLIPCGVAKSDVTLSAFTPTDGASGWAFDTDFLATLKTNGNLDKTYGYLSSYWAGEMDDASLVGWYDYKPLSEEDFSDDDRADNVKIPFGTGFLVYTSQANATITFAGEVLQDEVALSLNGGANTFVGNVTPVAVKLNSIAPTDGASGWAFDTDFLATLKTNGNLDKTYGYLSSYWAGEMDDASLVGWYDYKPLSEEDFSDDDRVPDTVVFNPGDGFLVYTSQANMELLIPSPL